MESTLGKRVRWWPLLLVLGVAGTVLVWIWGWYGDSRQDRNIATAQVIFAAFVLSLVWLAFFSRVKPWVRWPVIGLAVGSIISTAALFRIRGVTGDLLPILEFRWQSKDAREQPPAASQPLAAEINPSANDYPQFLGPNRNGIVAGRKLARDWKAHPPQLVWRQPIGTAWTGFAIVGGSAVTQEQRGEEERVVCYELLSGTVRWSHADQARYRTTIAGEGPRATPTVVSNRVYALGATGILNCLDLASGRLVWSKNILEDNRSRLNEWGTSGSPLVVENLVIVSADGKKNRSLVAYQRETGDFAWGGGSDGAGYSSPCLATIAGVRQILIFNAGSIAAHAIDSGEILWQHPWPRGHPHVAVPWSLPGDQVLVSSGYGTGSELLQIRRNSPWSAESVWKSTRLKAKFTNVVFHRGHIYGLDDGIMVCLDAATGQLRWKDGRYGHGQVILAGDLLLVMAESGDVILLEPIPDELRVLGRFSALSGKTWNPPALAGEYLLVRNDKEAACYRLPVVK